MGSGLLTVEVKRQEMVSADCPTAGDSWVSVISWLGSSGGGRTKQNIVTVKSVELINTL